MLFAKLACLVALTVGGVQGFTTTSVGNRLDLAQAFSLYGIDSVSGIDSHIRTLRRVCKGRVVRRGCMFVPRVTRQTWLAQDQGATDPVRKTPVQSIPTPAKSNSLSNVSRLQYAWFFAGLPAGSAVFPLLVDAAQSASEQADRRALIIAFLILKRVYLYAWAVSIVDMAARRSKDIAQGLGERIQELNTELFSGMVSQTQMLSLESSEAKAVYTSLNNLDGKNQAAALPIFLTLSLAASFALTQLSGAGAPADTNQLGALRISFEPFVSQISQISQAAVQVARSAGTSSCLLKSMCYVLK